MKLFYCGLLDKTGISIVNLYPKCNYRKISCKEICRIVHHFFLGGFLQGLHYNSKENKIMRLVTNFFAVEQ